MRRLRKRGQLCAQFPPKKYLLVLQTGSAIAPTAQMSFGSPASRDVKHRDATADWRNRAPFLMDYDTPDAEGMGLTPPVIDPDEEVGTNFRTLKW